MHINSIIIFLVLLTLTSCSKADNTEPNPHYNPKLTLEIPAGFPEFNTAVNQNPPTKYGAELGKKLFNEKKFSGNNTISCASCHKQGFAFADNISLSTGIYGRKTLRNASAIQNLAFMHFYNWDGSKLSLESQALVPILTHEEMNSSILEVIEKLEKEPAYPSLFEKAFGDRAITAERIFKSLAQYQYTLISSGSKYDKVIQNKGAEFTESEQRGYKIFQSKCAGCHATALFTDQSFRNIGFPVNPNTEEEGRARITGNTDDLMRFRVPSLRNVEYTAPYGSFGQFASLIELLDYLDAGVIPAANLDPILKENGNRIPMSGSEKQDIIEFLKTLSDPEFVGN